LNVKVHARDGWAELAGRYVVYEIENRYGDVGAGQVRGRREIGRLREQQDNVAMWSTTIGGSRSSVIRDGHATSSRHIQPRSAVFQGNTVDEPMTRLSFRLVRADSAGVGHDERKVAR